MVVTFDSVDARYTATVVEAKISQAERWVNEYCGQSFTGTIPDGVTFATLEMARYLMNRQMLEDDNIEEFNTPLRDVLQICKEPLDKHKVDISYSSSASSYYLPSLKDT